jgi:hypothetical protein
VASSVKANLKRVVVGGAKELRPEERREAALAKELELAAHACSLM